MFYLIQCLTFVGLCNVLSDLMSYIRWPVQSSPLAADPAAPGAWQSSSALAPALSAGRSTAAVSPAGGGPPCLSCCQSACCPAHSTVLPRRFITVQ